MHKNSKKCFDKKTIYKRDNTQYNGTMMEFTNKILSPIQTWQDFNPVSDDLEISILDSYIEDDITYTELLFTALTKDDGKVRVFLKYAKKGKVKDDAPIVLVIPNATGEVDKVISNSIVDEGYIYATFDYSGKGTKHTTYPNSLYYANFDAVENIIDVNGSAKNTCWYMWALICRRAITALCQQFGDVPLCLVGIDIGANIGWQVTGMDGRVSCFVPINGCGYIELMTNYYKPIVKNDSLTSWLAGVAPQAYAKYINCPILYVGGSNNSYSNIDKVQDIFGLTSSKQKFMSICQSGEDKITLDAYNTIKLWIRCFLQGDKDIELNTKVSLNNSEGKLYVNVNILDNDKVDRIRIFVAEKEQRSSIRDWKKISKYTALSNGEYVVQLTPEYLDEKVYCFVNTYYKDGLVLSSKVLGVVPKEIGVTNGGKATSPSRIIYNSSMSTSNFYGKNDSFVFDRQLIVKKEGAFNIKGVGIEGGGSLYTFKVGDKKYREEVNAVLQMDAYAEKDKTIEVVLYNLEEDLIPYKVSIFLKKCERWQQIRLSINDFKNFEMISLDDFDHIKAIELKNIDGVIFNNILWV